MAHVQGLNRIERRVLPFQSSDWDLATNPNAIRVTVIDRVQTVPSLPEDADRMAHVHGSVAT
jgi:hypothetical protein